jgi:hypothetical protein
MRGERRPPVTDEEWWDLVMRPRASDWIWFTSVIVGLAVVAVAIGYIFGDGPWRLITPPTPLGW